MWGQGHHSQKQTQETGPGMRLGEVQTENVRNKEQAGMGEGWVGRKESKWLGTSMACKPPVPVVSPQSLEWEQRFVPAITAIAVNRDLLTKCPICLGCCPTERVQSPTADTYFQTQLLIHLQERRATGKVSCTGI